MKRFKLYCDKDAEQDWIMEMSRKGWAFEHYFLGFYTFAPCKPGEYIYQIDLLDNWTGRTEDFSEFMEEMGVEVVSQWYRWVFLRKKASDGKFEMYTDTESKVAQYNRMRNFFTVGFILETICFSIELAALFRTEQSIYWVFTFTLGLLVLLFLRMIWKCSWKIQQLKREAAI